MIAVTFMLVMSLAKNMELRARAKTAGCYVENGKFWEIGAEACKLH